MVSLDGETVYQSSHPRVCDPCDQDPATDLDSEEPANLEDLLAEADDAPIKAERVVDERNTYIMNDMLKDVIRVGTGRRARTLERSDIAGKTGTTNDAADTWFLKALNTMGASRTGIVAALYTPFVYLLSAVFLGESLNLWQLAGFAPRLDLLFGGGCVLRSCLILCNHSL